MRWSAVLKHGPKSAWSEFARVQRSGISACHSKSSLCCLRPCLNMLQVTSHLRSPASCGALGIVSTVSLDVRATVILKHRRRVERPGFLSPSAGLKFADIPNGLAAVSKVPVAGWAQIAAYFGFVEFSGGFDDYKSGTPGDYGFKVLTSSDPAEKTKKLSAELANGRLAMMAIIGMFFQASSE